MELTNKSIVYLIISILLIAGVLAVTQKVFVDTNYNLHNLFNISNITISEIFTDGTLTLSSGNIINAGNLNASAFYQAGNLTLDTGDEANLNVNSSEYWDSLNTPTDFTTVGTYGTTNYAGDLVNATVMYEAGQEVATLNDLVTGNVTVTSIVAVKNVDGTTADKGAVMRFTGYNAGVERYDVVKAGNTNPEHHADCLMFSSTANNANGLCVIFGMVTGMDTDEWTELDMLFVNDTNGTLTSTRPAYAPCVQMIVQVMRSHSTVGTLRVHGSGRCNDVPNNFSITGDISANRINGNSTWKHQSYPTACSTYYAITTLADAPTCTYGIDLINWSGTSALITISGENITSGIVADARIASTIARDSELTINCTTDGYCGPITYDSEIAYISNCTDVDVCPNLYYLGGMTGENITGGTVDESYIDSTIARDSEVVLATGGIFSGAVNITGNITQYDHQYHCFNAACDAYIYYNSSSLVIKVN